MAKLAAAVFKSADNLLSQGSDMLARSVGIAALFVILAGAARADWQGDIEMKSAMMKSRGGGQMPMGKVRYKDGKLRMDMQMGPMNITSLTDLPTQKVFLINNEAKSYSEMNGDRAGAGPGDSLPKCKSLKFAACMKEMGMKKGGAEEANGQAATIWEGDHKTARGNRHAKFWHPDAAGDEFAFVRIESGEGERKSQVDILNWEKTSQPAADFQVPSDFTKSEGFPGMMGPGMGAPGARKGRGRPTPPQAADAPTGGETTEGKEKVEE